MPSTSLEKANLTFDNLFWNSSSENDYVDEGKLEIRQTRCSSLLHSMNFGSATEYTINQYKGCTHGCIYCYAPSLIHDERSWGSYVDAKINAHYVLDKELANAKKMVVFVSSASDPYQPVEARFKITRKVLGVLSRHEFPILLLTRSPLVLRDIDLLQTFDWVRVGFSISSVPKKFYEPGVPSLDKRLEALTKLRDKGILTWVSMAPIIPKLILMDHDSLFRKFKDAGVSAVTMGLLRFNGYEDSKRMFEERSGRTAEEVMGGGRQVYQEIRSKAESYGLDVTGESLSWKPDENPEGVRSLESFMN